jgi:hypothetical protein
LKISISGATEVVLFICTLKKNQKSPHLSHATNQVSRELWCRYVWVGQRFRSFFDLREKVFFFLSTMPEGYLSPRGLSFFHMTNFRGKKRGTIVKKIISAYFS